MKITGRHELRLKDLEHAMGDMAQSTKCCASGTCASFLSTTVVSKIDKSRDDKDAESLASQIGYMV